MVWIFLTLSGVCPLWKIIIKSTRGFSKNFVWDQAYLSYLSFTFIVLIIVVSFPLVIKCSLQVTTSGIILDESLNLQERIFSFFIFYPCAPCRLFDTVVISRVASRGAEIKLPPGARLRLRIHIIFSKTLKNVFEKGHSCKKVLKSKKVFFSNFHVPNKTVCHAKMLEEELELKPK